ncbi:MAG: hypothetical protein IKN43_08935 [Selenomonadaceae bacterium]|nr:hypothetical protein [Selenomonadaceae bacterium]
MSIAVELSPIEHEFVKAQAVAANLSVELFAHDAIMKAANNAAYIAKLEKADKQLREGKGVYKTMAELEAMEK